MITNNCFYIKTSVLEIYVGFQGMRNKEKNLIADPPNVRYLSMLGVILWTKLEKPFVVLVQFLK